MKDVNKLVSNDLIENNLNGKFYESIGDIDTADRLKKLSKFRERLKKAKELANKAI